MASTTQWMVRRVETELIAEDSHGYIVVQRVVKYKYPTRSGLAPKTWGILPTTSTILSPLCLLYAGPEGRGCSLERCLARVGKCMQILSKDSHTPPYTEVLSTPRKLHNLSSWYSGKLVHNDKKGDCLRQFAESKGLRKHDFSSCVTF